MDKKDKNKVIDLTEKNIEFSYKKIFDAEEMSELIEEFQAANKKYKELNPGLAKEKKIDAFRELIMSSLDKFTKLEEEATKELKAFENSNPNKDPNSPYPPDFGEKLIKTRKKTLKILAAIIAFNAIMKDWENLKKLLTFKRGKKNK
jgi:hypothetical protein